MKNAGAATLLLLIFAMTAPLFAESSEDQSKPSPRFALDIGAGIGVPNMASTMPWNGAGMNRYYGEYGGDFKYLLRPLKLNFGMGYEFSKSQRRGK